MLVSLTTVVDLSEVGLSFGVTPNIVDLYSYAVGVVGDPYDYLFLL